MGKKRDSLPLHQQVYRALERDIYAARWRAGERMPSEAELVRDFGVSRITVARALRDLQSAGLVDRRAGSGTYVSTRLAARDGLSFGLLIPDLGDTEIFEAICQGMMASPLAREHALLWGPATVAEDAREESAWALCRQYVERSVDGVFFAPLEFTPQKDEANRRIARALDEAGIPIVLLDRPVAPYPDRGLHDLVGINNRQAGFVITEHLVGAGAQRIAFVGMRHTAATVDARESGYREALYHARLPVVAGLMRRLDPASAEEVRALMEAERPDGIVCANDRTAGRLMHTLFDLGYTVPDEVRIVGIDDLDYAKLLPVPLTTFRQPTREIGAAALAAMLDRVAQRERATRDILLHGELVVRRSCGASG
jgi:DNA-binding LacI/PurR family transcriptional regulator